MSIGYDNISVNQGLLLDLQFKEGSGLITRDFADAHHKDPTLSGAPAWVQLANDLNVLDFDSANPDSVVILAADAVDLNFTTESFTIMLWIKSAYLLQQIFAKGNWGGPGFGYESFQQVALGQIDFAVHGATDYWISVFNPYPANTWALLTYIKSGTGINTTLNIYANGSLLDKTITGTPLDPTAGAFNFILGDDVVGGFGLTGRMYRPRIWKRALDPAEIKFIFESERGLFF